jgi:hypothetical protein
MGKRSHMCDEDCGKCPFASCNFNPLFPAVCSGERNEGIDKEEADIYALSRCEDRTTYRLATRYRAFIHD